MEAIVEIEWDEIVVEGAGADETVLGEMVPVAQEVVVLVQAERDSVQETAIERDPEVADMIAMTTVVNVDLGQQMIDAMIDMKAIGRKVVVMKVIDLRAEEVRGVRDSETSAMGLAVHEVQTLAVDSNLKVDQGAMVRVKDLADQALVADQELVEVDARLVERAVRVDNPIRIVRTKGTSANCSEMAKTVQLNNPIEPRAIAIEDLAAAIALAKVLEAVSRGEVDLAVVEKVVEVEPVGAEALAEEMVSEEDLSFLAMIEAAVGETKAKVDRSLSLMGSRGLMIEVSANAPSIDDRAVVKVHLLSPANAGQNEGLLGMVDLEAEIQGQVGEPVVVLAID